MHAALIIQVNYEGLTYLHVIHIRNSHHAFAKAECTEIF